MAASGDSAWRDRIAAVAEAFEAAGREILNSPDGREAYRRANELREVREDQDGLQAWLRAHSATWIREAEHMSLGQLAAELGLSRGRIQQFEKMGAQQRQAELGVPPDQD